MIFTWGFQQFSLGFVKTCDSYTVRLPFSCIFFFTLITDMPLNKLITLISENF